MGRIKVEQIETVVKSAKQSFDKQKKFSDSRETITELAAQLENCADNHHIPSIPISWIKPRNIREFSTESQEFEQLVLSIKDDGLVNLPTITTHKGNLYIVDGHRRIEALKQIGVAEVDCILKHGKLFEIETMQAMANLATEQMSLMEQADVAQRFEDQGMHIKDIATRLRMDRKKASKLLMLAKWPLVCRETVAKNPTKLTQTKVFSFIRADMDEAEILAGLEALLYPKRQGALSKRDEIKEKLSDYASKEGLTERDTEIIARALVVLGFVKSEVGLERTP